MNISYSSVSNWSKTGRSYIVSHKLLSTIAAVIIIGGGYYWYSSATNTGTQTKYVLGTVTTGTVISTVSGSGQVSALNQVDIHPKVSGQVTQVLAKNGEVVSAGQALAYIDATDAYNSVNSAKADLTSAQISLQKLQEPVDQLSATQAQDAIARAQDSQANATTALAKQYTQSNTDIISTMLDLPAVMTNFKDIMIGTEASHSGGSWNIDYYQTATANWDNNSIAYRNTAFSSYTNALAQYNATLADYQAVGSDLSATTTESLANETYLTAKAITTALTAANSYLQFYEDQSKAHNQVPSPTADTGLANLATYISQMNSHVSTLLSDTNTLTTDKQAISDAQRTITEDQQSLAKLQQGTDTLDIQSAQLNIQQKQNALQQAEDTLSDYTVRAPFAGTLAGVSLHTGDTASNGSTVATIVTTQELADLSLNEVDAAKVTAGQKVTLTFDAISDLTLTGQVADVSPLGTVSQGVVSYDVKIAFDTQDSRVKAGMTVNADIQTAVHQDVLVVPASAIKTSGGVTSVAIFNPAIANTGGTSGVASLIAPTNVPIVVGISDDTNTEVTAGLTAGEQVVTRTISGTAATTKTSASTATSRSGFGGAGGGGGAAAGAIRL